MLRYLMAEPAYSFTIPSLADDTPLDCRIYHPDDFAAVIANAAENGHATRGAIVAHPYPVLGGCYDDPVVMAVVRCLLKEGFVVGTFNFRGAASSKGSTSWTGRPEKEDYTSFAGFMVYYLQQLQPKDGLKRLSTIVSARTSRIDGLDPAISESETSSPRDSSRSSNVTLLLSGYSYGFLILSRLPPVADMLCRFESAPRGTTAAEIILRAYQLAKESRSILEVKQALPQSRGRRLTPSDATKPRLHASPVIVGGEETPPQERRHSRETSRGANIVHRGVEVPLRIANRMRRRSSGVRPGTGHGPMRSEESVATGTTTPVPSVRVMYLLISPVLPPLAHTLVPPASWTGMRGAVDKSTGVGSLTCPTLAVWGSIDSFTSNRRLKAWAERLSKAGPAAFKWLDFEGAGHFWREQGVMKLMTEGIANWVRENA